MRNYPNNAMKWLSTGVVALLLMMTNCASASSSAISAVWANDGGDKVTQDELRASNGGNVANSIWQGGTISLFGAKNEVVSFNLVIEAASRSAANVNVSLSNLTGPGGYVIRSSPRATNNLFNWTGTEAELFFVRYLQIKGLSYFGYVGYGLVGDGVEPQIPAKLRLPLVGGSYTGGWVNRPNHDKFYPDIAVPLELTPNFAIAAASNQSIWADIYIPKTAVPGPYIGTISVSENGIPTYLLPVTLTVRNFALPDIPSSKTLLYSTYSDISTRYTGVAFPGARTPQDNLAQQALQNQRMVAHRHKISMGGDDGAADTFGTQPGTSLIPALTGALFTAANGYAGPGTGVGSNVYIIGKYGQWETGTWPATQAGFWTNTNAWESWFQANSPATDRFVYISDESSNYPQTQKWANWMATNPGVGKNLKSMATVSPMNAVASVPSLSIPTSVFGAGGSLLGSSWASAVAAIQSAPGKEFWMYNGSRPGAGVFYTEGDGTDLREKAWGQYKKGVARWFYWQSTYYNQNQTGNGQTDVFNTAATFAAQNPTLNPYFGLQYLTNGDGVLFYPGTDVKFPASSYGISGPIASLRLKHWRRGVQDVDYLTLAKAINPSAVAALVQRMVPLAMWELTVHDPSDPTYYYKVGPSWSSDPDVWEAARAQLAAILDPISGSVPVNTAVPTISGTAQVGQTLAAATGTWTNNPTSYAYQWAGNGTNILGAAVSTYVPVTGDIGHTLTVSVVATNASGPGAPAASVATSPVIDIIPVNTVAPAISGNAQVGQTLAATPGTWTHNPASYAYQWAGNGTNILGATASTYVPVTGDTGHTLTVSVIATNSGGASAPAISASTAAVTEGPATVPVNTAVPTIAGTAQVGQTLAAATGTWTNNPTSYAYQWAGNGTDIPGATASTYVPAAADVGNTLAVSVIATNAAGSSAPATSNPTSAVIAIGSAPVNLAAPVVTGTAQVGQTLATSNGTWAYSPTSYTYQWNRFQVGTIPGATASTYTPVVADIGNAIQATVIATNSVGSSHENSSPTSVVIAAAAAVPVNSVLPAISGVAQVGQTLAASTGTWTNSPTSYAYQWAGNGTNIPGATASTYVPATVDIGHTLTVSVTATNSGGASTPAISAPTSAVTAVPVPVPVNIAAPAIAGTAQVGQTLTCSTGTWTNNPTEFFYAWVKSSGAIPGANSPSYIPVASDIGSVLVCWVMARNSGGPSVPVASAPTSAVLPVPVIPVAAITTATATVACGPPASLTATFSGANLSAAHQYKVDFTIAGTPGPIVVTRSLVIPANTSGNFTVPFSITGSLPSGVTFTLTGSATLRDDTAHADSNTIPVSFTNSNHQITCG